MVSSPHLSCQHVAWLKKLTLPRLELKAVSVCTGLPHFIPESLKSRFTNLSVKLWSHSEIFPHCLHSLKPLKQFIANRTKEIKKLFSATVWNDESLPNSWQSCCFTHLWNQCTTTSKFPLVETWSTMAPVQIPVARLEPLTSPSPKSLTDS